MKDSLEALEFINKEALILHFNSKISESVEELMSAYDTIKQDLERLKILEEENKELKEKLNKGLVIFEQNKKLFSDIEELKQVIEILKDKKVNIGLLLKTDTLNQYNRVRHLYNADFLTQEEYELLKGVFKND